MELAQHSLSSHIEVVVVVVVGEWRVVSVGSPAWTDSSPAPAEASIKV